MSSIIPEYNYDIFISYRQKDNKGDKWVSEFVEALKTELEATFKEDVSIYFDENPHDRLQETHNVDKSLESKLKCLIFIPILSQTYCDPNSYAWQNEFLSFLKSVKNDRFGKDVKLRGGNVASRVLPIRIHDLEPEDVKLFEKETGSVLRSLDFVYKTASGVNRPLQPEDDKNDNLNKTLYRDQINKVAGAIKEIIISIKKEIESAVQGKNEKRVEEVQSSDSIEKGSKRRITPQSRKWLLFTLPLLLVTVVVILIYSVLNYSKQSQKLTDLDKSIAVLPFVNDSPDKENDYVCNGMMEEILNQLQKISDLRVKSRTSSEKYRNSGKDIREIGKELNVSMIMEGSVRKIGDDLRIYTQLINAKTGDHLWSEVYDGKYTTDILSFLPQVARRVANSLNVVITPKEEKIIATASTSNMQVYDLKLKADEMIRQWQRTYDSIYLKSALNLINQSLNLEPGNSDALRSKGWLFREASNFDSALFYIRKVISLDPDNPLNNGNIGLTFAFGNKPDSALKYLSLSVERNPDEPWINLAMGQCLWFFKNDIVEALPYYQKANELYKEGGSIYTNIAMVYISIGDYVKALKYYYNSLLHSSSYNHLKDYCVLLSYSDYHGRALKCQDSVCSINAFGAQCDMLRFYIMTLQKDFKEAERYYNKAVNAGYRINEDDEPFVALMYKETGKNSEALSIIMDAIKANEAWLKNNPNSIYRVITIYRLVQLYTLQGDKAKLKKALSEYNLAELGGLFLLDKLPGYNNLRNDPGLKDLFRSIEQKKDSLRRAVRDMEMRGEIDL